MKTMSYEQIFNEEIKPQSFGWQRLGAIPMGIVMTLVLLFAMRELVNTDFTEVDIEPSIPIPDVSMNIPEFIEVREEELPDRPEIIEQPPKLEFEEPVIAKVDTGVINARSVYEKIKITPGTDIGFSGQPMPIVRINPNYPASAVSRNIEGYVDVVFDITPIGTTTNVRITGYSPSTVFNASVLKAVRGWKYRAAADDTGAQTTLDVKERITFVLEK